MNPHHQFIAIEETTASGPALKTEIRFAPRPTKRKKFNGACEVCKKRKKRCTHEEVSHLAGQADDAPLPVQETMLQQPISNPPSASHHGIASPDAVQPVDLQNKFNAQNHHAPRLTSQRFVGDLNPEAAFLSPPTADSQQAMERHEIGVWLENPPRKPSEAAISSISSVLPQSSQIALIDIYFSRVNHILPIVDETSFRLGLSESTLPQPLIQVVCLVAAKDASAKALLPNSTNTRSLCRQLHTSIVHNLQSDSKYEKITLIRILILCSLHSEGPGGAEEASMHLAQAVHHAQTIGLHLDRAKTPDYDRPRNRLFWCLWSLDKLNAATNGRPVMINDIDVSIHSFVAENEADVSFAIFLRIADMLNKIIGLYRPSALPDATGWEDEFPGFEEIVDQNSGTSLDENTLTTLHAFFLAVAILSSRSRPERVKSLSTPSSVRQKLAALEITQFLCQDPATGLLPLPLIPYAISLSLSVWYREMRQSKLPHQKRQAKSQFQICHKTIEDLKTTWWSADIMASLSRTVIERIDKLSKSSGLPITARRYVPTSVTVTVTSQPSPIFSPAQELQSQKNSRDATSQVSTSSVNTRHLSSHHDPRLTNNPNSPLVEAQTELLAHFDNIDNIFGTYLDPNIPMNYEDVLRLESFESTNQFSWSNDWGN